MSATPSPEEIKLKRTGAGGWTRATLASWGIEWPPPKGWRRLLEDKWRKEYAAQENGAPEPKKLSHRGTTAATHTLVVNPKSSQNSESDSLVIYTDGAFALGIAGWSFVVFEGPEKIYETAGVVADGYGSRNVTAELYAVVQADLWLQANYPQRCATIISDYQGVIFWMSGEWKTRSTVSQDYVDVLQPRRKFLKFQWIRSHNFSLGNCRADKLAVDAIKKRGSLNQEERELAILTTAHSQQIAILPVAPTLAGVPKHTYRHHFYPYSLAFSPKLARVFFVLVLLVLWN